MIGNPASNYQAFIGEEWRNWYTRRAVITVRVASCGFKSRLLQRLINAVKGVSNRCARQSGFVKKFTNVKSEKFENSKKANFEPNNSLGEKTQLLRSLALVRVGKMAVNLADENAAVGVA